MIKIPAVPPPPPLFHLHFLLLLFLCLFSRFGQCGPAISGLPPNEGEEKTPPTSDAAQHQRHAFNMLEPELAANIFNREGAAKNPLRRTTTMPLTDKLDIGHNGGGGGGGGQQQQKVVAGMAAVSTTAPQQQKPAAAAAARGRRSIQQSEYEALNEDFVSEYDALNLDFNLDEDGGGKAAKGLEVPGMELIWEDGAGGGEKKKEEFPPKEWWGDEEEDNVSAKEEENNIKTPNKEKRPALKASKLLEEPTKERRRGPPREEDEEEKEEKVDLPTAANGGNKRSGRARRGAARVEGVARLDGWPTRPFASVDREELKIVPRLVPSYPPPPITTTTTSATTTIGLATTSKGAAGGKLRTKQLPQRRLPKKQQIQKPQEEIFRDLPSGLDESAGLSASDGSKPTTKLPPPPQPHQLVPSADLFPTGGNGGQFLPQHSPFRPFPDGQQPFQPVLNLGSSSSSSAASQSQSQSSPPRHENIGQIPTGFVHIATLDAPPQQLGGNQILINGKHFWVERTVPVGQFHQQQNTKPQQAKEHLPDLLETPKLDEHGNIQGKMTQQPEDAVVEETKQGEEEKQQQQSSVANGDIPENGQQRASPPKAEEENAAVAERRQSPSRSRTRVANSGGRVFTPADGENGPTFWGNLDQSPAAAQWGPISSQQPQEQQQQQWHHSKQKPLSGNSKTGSLLALNLGTALSQIFGNFTIEHDAKIVESQQPDPAFDFGPPSREGGIGSPTKGGGGEANSEPHRITRFFDRPQRHLHEN